MPELSQSLVSLLYDQLDNLYHDLQSYEDRLGEAENDFYDAEKRRNQFTRLKKETQEQIDEIERLTDD